VDVTWNAVLPNNTGSVLYLVERRSLSGGVVGRHAHRPHDDDASTSSPWQQTEQVTSAQGTRQLKHVFELSAVSRIEKKRYV